jgi:hypothetical protein
LTSKKVQKALDELQILEYRQAELKEPSQLILNMIANERKRLCALSNASPSTRAEALANSETKHERQKRLTPPNEADTASKK